MMIKNSITIKCLFVATLLSSTLVFAVEYSSQEIEKTMQELKRTNESVAKINQLFVSCKMQSNCIYMGLKQLVANENDAVAKLILSDYEKKKQINRESLEYCYQLELRQVNKALIPCAKDPSFNTPSPTEAVNECVENQLISLIQSGNTLAKVTLLGFFRNQNNAQKLEQVKANMARQEPPKDKNTLNECLSQMPDTFQFEHDK